MLLFEKNYFGKKHKKKMGKQCSKVIYIHWDKFIKGSG
jgi:hypothetical protein